MSNPFLPDDAQIPPQFTGLPAGGAGNPFPPVPGAGQGPQLPPNYRPAPTLSVLAILSLIAGLGGIITCCCWLLSAPMSLTAVALGHLAVFNIKRSEGRQQGLAVAYIGLGLGYLAIVMILALLLFGLFGPKPDPNNPRTNSARAKFGRAESLIDTDSNGVAQGNTPEAVALAKKFSNLMTELREKMFTKRDKGAFSLTKNQFITYCELHEGKCVFIVHVPAYKNFADDAKESLAEIAWAAAQKSVEDTLHEGDDLGVGMKGVVLYGKVMVGKVVDDPTELKSGIERESENSQQWLLPFFEEPVRAAEAEAMP